ncbi:hypothetical protein F5B17DRAFT_400181 [Nemania serpens]|nr:hypothetical protein F5B17DRAFT_400181 [Nemania serpens]
MQPKITLAVVTIAILGSLPSAVLGAPAAASPRAEVPDSTPLLSSLGLGARQYYDGPCSHTDCGAERVNCRDRRLWCVPWPSFSMPEGCTCSPL